jgi:hypothetical protein
MFVTLAFTADVAEDGSINLLIYLHIRVGLNGWIRGVFVKSAREY